MVKEKKNSLFPWWQLLSTLLYMSQLRNALCCSYCSPLNFLDHVYLRHPQLNIDRHPRLTLDPHLDWHSVDTWLRLNQHLINSWSRVCWVLTDSYVSIDTWWHICKHESTLDQLLTRMSIKSQLSVSRVLIKHRLSVSWGSILGMDWGYWLILDRGTL